MMQFNAKTFLCPVSRENTLQNCLFYLDGVYKDVFLYHFCALASISSLSEPTRRFGTVGHCPAGLSPNGIDWLDQ